MFTWYCCIVLYTEPWFSWILSALCSSDICSSRTHLWTSVKGDAPFNIPHSLLCTGPSAAAAGERRVGWLGISLTHQDTPLCPIKQPIKQCCAGTQSCKIWPEPNDTKQQGVTYIWTLGCFDHLCHLSSFEDIVLWSANVSGSVISSWWSIEYRLILLRGLFWWRDVTECGYNQLFSSEQIYMALFPIKKWFCGEMCCKEFYYITERLNVNIDMFWGGLFGVIWGFFGVCGYSG